MFKPRHTLQSVLTELVHGLEDGSIVLSLDAEARTPLNEAEPNEKGSSEANGKGAAALDAPTAEKK